MDTGEFALRDLEARAECLSLGKLIHNSTDAVTGQCLVSDLKVGVERLVLRQEDVGLYDVES